MNVPGISHLLGRRELFQRVGGGFAGIALASLLLEEQGIAAPVADTLSPHIPPRQAVIQLFQHGGPSHMDLLDPKPELNQRNGQPMPKYFTDLVAISAHGGLLGTPFKFTAGQSGIPYSEIIPHTASCADDIAVVRSMYTEHNNHEQALWMMHGGLTVPGRPTLGAWVNYALGSENRDLPAYVVLRNDAALPVDGIRNWSAGWLPPRYAGVVHLRTSGPPVLYLQPGSEVPPAVSKLRTGLLESLNNSHRTSHQIIDPQLEARIASYELAARMQVSATEALDLANETEETQKLYGLDNAVTAPYARRCLMARRLVERRALVQIFVEGQRWDTHADNANATKKICDETDRPTAALLKDLKQHGLLDSTLVVWGGEFGRTPVSQGGNGRDHHKQGFSVWMAGGGIKGGQAYGATDELGYHAVENRVKVSDFHATIMHLLGLDHKRVNYHLRGRDERLTDVYDAKVLTPLLA